MPAARAARQPAGPAPQAPAGEKARRSRPRRPRGLSRAAPASSIIGIPLRPGGRARGPRRRPPRPARRGFAHDSPDAMTAAPSLSHLDESGQIRMVDVGDKAATQRTAVASGRVRLSAPAYALLTQPGRGKGEVLNTARVAGILAAKRCAELIPLCHSLPLSFVGVDFALDDAAGAVSISATCRSDYKTGVEMEAMTAVSVAALTIYDMCKAADKGIVIEAVRLESKSGGKSGDWRADR